MNAVSKKSVLKKAIPDTEETKPLPETKNIGLEEQIAEARRLYRLLENPELLWAHKSKRIPGK